MLGYIVRGPIGGLAWHHLQYVLGLARLGHDVYFLEDSEDYAACYHPELAALTCDPAYGLEFARSSFARLDLAEHWAYYDAHTDQWLGPAGGKALEVCSTAKVLLNVSGITPLRDWSSRVPVRIFIDTDPAFTQIRNLTDPAARGLGSRAYSLFHFRRKLSERPVPCPG